MPEELGKHPVLPLSRYRQRYPLQRIRADPITLPTLLQRTGLRLADPLLPAAAPTRAPYPAPPPPASW